MLAAAFLLLVQALSSEATSEQLASAFDRFCLKTGADRARFDAEIERSPDAVKVSRPLVFSGFEFNRRWNVGGVNLAFLDAPPPNPRSCSVGATSRGGYDGPAVLAWVAALPGVVDMRLVEQVRSIGFARWVGSFTDGGTIIVNNRPNPSGFGDVEIILRPAH